MLGARAIRTQRRRQDSITSRDLPQYQRPRTVADQQAGVTVLPIGHRRYDFTADYQHRPVKPAADKLLGHRHPIDKTRTNCRQVECRHPRQPQTLPDQAGGRRKLHIRRHCRHNDQVEFRRRNTGPVQRLLRRR